MEKKLITELESYANNGMLYDYVANNYTCMDRDDLKAIISELIWVASQMLGRDKEIKFQKEVVNSLLENQCDED